MKPKTIMSIYVAPECWPKDKSNVVIYGQRVRLTEDYDLGKWDYKRDSGKIEFVRVDKSVKLSNLLQSGDTLVLNDGKAEIINGPNHKPYSPVIPN